MKDIANIIFKGTCDLAVAKKCLLMMRSILAKVGFFVIYACDVAHLSDSQSHTGLICQLLRFYGQFVFIFL